MSRQYDQKALGSRIAEYRSKLNLSQSQFAKLSGVSKGYLSKLELGLGNTISFDKLNKIVTALGIKFDDLLVDSLSKYETETTNNEIIDYLQTCNKKEQALFYEILLDFIDRNI